VRDHGFPWGYTSVKTRLRTADLVERAKRWLAGRPALDLIVTMNDATSTIYSAFLVEEEGTVSTFRALLDSAIIIGPTSIGLPVAIGFVARALRPAHRLDKQITPVEPIRLQLLL
jgi:hypothetical protein